MMIRPSRSATLGAVILASFCLFAQAQSTPKPGADKPATAGPAAALTATPAATPAASTAAAPPSAGASAGTGAASGPAAASCVATATEKKLAGAAKNSFMKNYTSPTIA